MSRELIGTEYFSNIYYTDINIVKKKMIYEVKIYHGDCLYIPSLHWYQSKTTSDVPNDYYP